MLLHIVRLMELDRLRVVDAAEIDQACQKWLLDGQAHKKRKVGPGSVASFTNVAVKWFRYLNVLSQPTPKLDSVDVIIEDFAHFLRTTRGMTIETIRCYRTKLVHFLRWVSDRRPDLSSISLIDVDEYLQIKQADGCRPRTIVAYCTAFRLFFRFSEVWGWSHSNIAGCIKGPRVPRYDRNPKGPEWKDVRRLLDSEMGTKPSDLRTAAILFLCSIYALRCSEVTNLTLDDFDWANEIVTVRRAKRGRVQQYPIQFEVGETILRYLRHGRPRCGCRHLFLTMRPPYRPMRPATLWTIVAPRIKALGICSAQFGAHSLRHSCATHLLHQGSPLKDIADFLGHRDTKSVSIYAKYDLDALKEVASMSLAYLR